MHKHVGSLNEIKRGDWSPGWNIIGNMPDFINDDPLRVNIGT
jgi:hypothetical protein